jgi:tRNA(fMet)-specific endonuclease VapC
MRGKHTALKNRFDRSAGEICISAITLGELSYGAENSARRDVNLRALAEFASRVEVIPFSSDAASHYGQIRAALKSIGQLIGYHDMLIGAHARSKGLIFVTGNRREFDRVPGLRVENWA